MKNLISLLSVFAALNGFSQVYTTPEVVTNIARGEAFSILGSITNGGGGTTNIIIVTNVLPSNLITQYYNGAYLTGTFSGVFRGNGASLSNVQPASANLTNWSMLSTSVLTTAGSTKFNNSQFTTNGNTVSFRANAPVTNLFNFGTLNMSSLLAPETLPYFLWDSDAAYQLTMNFRHPDAAGDGQIVKADPTNFKWDFSNLTEPYESWINFNHDGAQFSFPPSVTAFVVSSQLGLGPGVVSDYQLASIAYVKDSTLSHRSYPSNVVDTAVPLTNGVLANRGGTNFWTLDGSSLTNIQVSITNLANIVTQNMTGTMLSGTFSSGGTYPIWLTNTSNEGYLMGLGSDASTNIALRWDASNNRLIAPAVAATGIFIGDGSSVTNVTANTLVNETANPTVIPASADGVLVFSGPHGNLRATVHPNALALATNWPANAVTNGANLWLAFTGTTNQTVSAFGTDTEDPFVASSSDGGLTWRVRTPFPLQTRAAANTLAGWGGTGWQADTELYISPDGVMHLIWSGFLDGVNFNSVLFHSSTADGDTWSTPEIMHAGPTLTEATYAGPQVVTMGDGTLRLYYVDENYGTNALLYQTGLDLSGTNWNWSETNFCDTLPYTTNTSAPWHFDMVVRNGAEHIFYGSQSGNPGEYATSTNANIFSAGVIGFWPLATLTNQNSNQQWIYKVTVWPSQTAPDAWNAIVGLSPANPTDMEGWAFKLIRDYQPDFNRMSVKTHTTNTWDLVGASKTYLGAARPSQFAVYEQVAPGNSATVTLGRKASGYGAVGFGTTPLNGSTRYALAGDGSVTLLNTFSDGRIRVADADVGGWAAGGIYAAASKQFSGSGAGLTNVTATTLVNAANVTNLSVWGSGPADGTRLWYMDEQLAYTAGTWYFGGGVDFSGAEVEGLVGITTTASGVPLAARGTAAQSTNLFELQDSDSNVVASVSSAGVFTGNGSGLTNLNPATALAGAGDVTLNLDYGVSLSNAENWDGLGTDLTLESGLSIRNTTGGSEARVTSEGFVTFGLASFTGNGGGLTNLNMTNVVGTQLNFGEGATITRGPGEVLEFSTEIVGMHVGTGDGLTNLNASTLASGTIPKERNTVQGNIVTGGGVVATNDAFFYLSTNATGPGNLFWVGLTNSPTAILAVSNSSVVVGGTIYTSGSIASGGSVTASSSSGATSTSAAMRTSGGVRAAQMVSSVGDILRTNALPSLASIGASSCWVGFHTNALMYIRTDAATNGAYGVISNLP